MFYFLLKLPNIGYVFISTKFDLMANEVLAEIDRRNIIFDVVDGIPPSGDESDEIRSFRTQIEADNLMLEYSAEELGFNNVLFEYLSQG